MQPACAAHQDVCSPNVPIQGEGPRPYQVCCTKWPSVDLPQPFLLPTDAAVPGEPKNTAAGQKKANSSAARGIWLETYC